MLHLIYGREPLMDGYMETGLSVDLAQHLEKKPREDRVKAGDTRARKEDVKLILSWWLLFCQFQLCFFLQCGR